MFATLACIATEHDQKLLLLAAAICVLSALATLIAYRRGLRAVGAYASAWRATASVLGGAGVWSTHFLAMLAYRPGLPIGFQPWLTLGSLLVAVAGFGVGYTLHRHRRTAAARAAAGMVIGLAIAVMHFMGLAAIEIGADLHLQPLASALAMAAGVALSALALGAVGPEHGQVRTGAATVLLSGAILALHFTAMAAVSFTPNPAKIVAYDLVEPRDLAMLVTAADLVILSVAAAVLGLEQLGARSTLAALAGALDGAPSGLAFFDRNDRLVFCNTAFSDALGLVGVAARRGLTLGDIRRGLASATWLPEDLRDRARSPTELRTALCDGPMVMHAPSGRWLQVAFGDTRDGGVVVVLNDVTAERAARELADQANQTKSDFLANVSHEIRTPLNGVIGMAQVMALHPLDAGQRERLDAIRASGEGLLRLLNSILDMAKIEAGRIEIELAPADVEQIARQACEPFAAIAAEKGVTFEVTVDPEAQGLWLTDGARLGQVLANLASNAVKFTACGAVRVGISVCDDALRFEVSDTGPGIPAEDIGKLFKKFSQADGSISRRYGGTGLGLAISAQLVELLGGRIEVTSTPGVGANFTFALPMAHAGPRESGTDLRADPSELRAPQDDGALRVLAVDDNPTNRQVIAAMLEALGLEVVLAASGPEALAIFVGSRFDLVLMDIQMPGMSGVEAAREIIAIEAAAGRAATPIVALTANVMSHQIDDYVAAGMCGVIAKPIELSALVAGIEAALSGGEGALAA